MKNFNYMEYRIELRHTANRIDAAGFTAMGIAVLAFFVCFVFGVGASEAGIEEDVKNIRLGLSIWMLLMSALSGWLSWHLFGMSHKLRTDREYAANWKSPDPWSRGNGKARS